VERKDEMMPTSPEAQSRVLSEAVARVSALWGIGDDLLAQTLASEPVNISCGCMRSWERR